MARIGFNAHLLPRRDGYRAAGVATYVRQLVDTLPRVAPEHEYVFFGPPGISVEGGVASRANTESPAVRILWEQLAAPRMISKHGLDLLHSPSAVAPLCLTARSVVTVHDLAFEEHPDRFRRADRAILAPLARASIRRAAAVIAVSESTREQVVRRYHIEPARIVVIPEAPGPRYRVDPECARPLAEPYILHVGTIEPRKNIDLLLRAFARLRAQGYPHRLALVGGRGWMCDDLTATIERLGVRESVLEVGFARDLVPWYNHADLFVYPSASEGFGLPPLEAMACGAPTIVSSGGALPEVAGDAAMVVPVGDEDRLLDAMRSVLLDSGTAARLSAAGRARADHYSWTRTAIRTAEVYAAVIAEGRRSRAAFGMPS